MHLWFIRAYFIPQKHNLVSFLKVLIGCTTFSLGSKLCYLVNSTPLTLMVLIALPHFHKIVTKVTFFFLLLFKIKKCFGYQFTQHDLSGQQGSRKEKVSNNYSQPKLSYAIGVHVLKFQQNVTIFFRLCLLVGIIKLSVWILTATSLPFSITVKKFGKDYPLKNNYKIV